MPPKKTKAAKAAKAAAATGPDKSLERPSTPASPAPGNEDSDGFFSAPVTKGKRGKNANNDTAQLNRWGSGNLNFGDGDADDDAEGEGDDAEEGDGKKDGENNDAVVEAEVEKEDPAAGTTTATGAGEGAGAGDTTGGGIFSAFSPTDNNNNSSSSPVFGGVGANLASTFGSSLGGWGSFGFGGGDSSPTTATREDKALPTPPGPAAASSPASAFGFSSSPLARESITTPAATTTTPAADTNTNAAPEDDGFETTVGGRGAKSKKGLLKKTEKPSSPWGGTPTTATPPGGFSAWGATEDDTAGTAAGAGGDANGDADPAAEEQVDELNLMDSSAAAATAAGADPTTTTTTAPAPDPFSPITPLAANANANADDTKTTDLDTKDDEKPIKIKGKKNNKSADSPVVPSFVAADADTSLSATPAAEPFDDWETPATTAAGKKAKKNDKKTKLGATKVSVLGKGAGGTAPTTPIVSRPPSPPPAPAPTEAASVASPAALGGPASTPTSAPADVQVPSPSLASLEPALNGTKAGKGAKGKQQAKDAPKRPATPTLDTSLKPAATAVSPPAATVSSPPKFRTGEETATANDVDNKLDGIWVQSPALKGSRPFLEPTLSYSGFAPRTSEPEPSPGPTPTGNEVVTPRATEPIAVSSPPRPSTPPPRSPPPVTSPTKSAPPKSPKSPRSESPELSASLISDIIDALGTSRVDIFAPTPSAVGGSGGSEGGGESVWSEDTSDFAGNANVRRRAARARQQRAESSNGAQSNDEFVPEPPSSAMDGYSSPAFPDGFSLPTNVSLKDDGPYVSDASSLESPASSVEVEADREPSSAVALRPSAALSRNLNSNALLRREVNIRPPSVPRGRNLRITTTSSSAPAIQQPQHQRSASTRKDPSSESDPRTHVHSDTSIEGISTPSDISHSISSLSDDDRRRRIEGHGRPKAKEQTKAKPQQQQKQKQQTSTAMVIHDDVMPMPPPPDNTAETVSLRSPITETYDRGDEASSEANESEESEGSEGSRFQIDTTGLLAAPRSPDAFVDEFEASKLAEAESPVRLTLTMEERDDSPNEEEEDTFAQNTPRSRSPFSQEDDLRHDGHGELELDREEEDTVAVDASPKPASLDPEDPDHDEEERDDEAPSQPLSEYAPAQFSPPREIYHDEFELDELMSAKSSPLLSDHDLSPSVPTFAREPESPVVAVPAPARNVGLKPVAAARPVGHVRSESGVSKMTLNTPQNGGLAMSVADSDFVAAPTESDQELLHAYEEERSTVGERSTIANFEEESSTGTARQVQKEPHPEVQVAPVIEEDPYRFAAVPPSIEPTSDPADSDFDATESHYTVDSGSGDSSGATRSVLVLPDLGDKFRTIALPLSSLQNSRRNSPNEQTVSENPFSPAESLGQPLTKNSLQNLQASLENMPSPIPVPPPPAPTTDHASFSPVVMSVRTEPIIMPAVFPTPDYSDASLDLESIDDSLQQAKTIHDTPQPFVKTALPSFVRVHTSQGSVMSTSSMEPPLTSGSDSPLAPSSPRSELGVSPQLTDVGDDTRSEVSDASVIPGTPGSPRPDLDEIFFSAGLRDVWRSEVSATPRSTLQSTISPSTPGLTAARSAIAGESNLVTPLEPKQQEQQHAHRDESKELPTMLPDLTAHEEVRMPQPVDFSVHRAFVPALRRGTPAQEPVKADLPSFTVVPPAPSSITTEDGAELPTSSDSMATSAIWAPASVIHIPTAAATANEPLISEPPHAFDDEPAAAWGAETGDEMDALAQEPLSVTESSPERSPPRAAESALPVEVKAPVALVAELQSLAESASSVADELAAMVESIYTPTVLAMEEGPVVSSEAQRAVPTVHEEIMEHPRVPSVPAPEVPLQKPEEAAHAATPDKSVDVPASRPVPEVVEKAATNSAPAPESKPEPLVRYKSLILVPIFTETEDKPEDKAEEKTDVQEPSSTKEETVEPKIAEPVEPIEVPAAASAPSSHVEEPKEEIVQAPSPVADTVASPAPVVAPPVEEVVPPPVERVVPRRVVAPSARAAQGSFNWDESLIDSMIDASPFSPRRYAVPVDDEDDSASDQYPPLSGGELSSSVPGATDYFEREPEPRPVAVAPVVPAVPILATPSPPSRPVPSSRDSSRPVVASRDSSRPVAMSRESSLLPAARVALPESRPDSRSMSRLSNATPPSVLLNSSAMELKPSVRNPSSRTGSVPPIITTAPPVATRAAPPPPVIHAPVPVPARAAPPSLARRIFEPSVIDDPADAQSTIVPYEDSNVDDDAKSDSDWSFSTTGPEDDVDHATQTPSVVGSTAITYDPKYTAAESTWSFGTTKTANIRRAHAEIFRTVPSLRPSGSLTSASSASASLASPHMQPSNFSNMVHRDVPVISIPSPRTNPHLPARFNTPITTHYSKSMTYDGKAPDVPGRWETTAAEVEPTEQRGSCLVM